MSLDSAANDQHSDKPDGNKPCVFLSYGRADAKDLADRLCIDLAAHGFGVWQDTKEIRAANAWHHEIEDGLRSCQLVVALLSPHAVRRESEASRDYSVCLDEWSFAQFELRRPIVPVLARACPAPLFLHRLDYVDLCRWRDTEEQYQAGFAKLLKTLQDALNGKVSYRSWDKMLKPLDFAAFLHGRRRDFTGRQWLFDEIETWRTVSGDDRVLLIKGDPGVGKSAIIAELAHRNARVLAYHCCQADNQQTLDPGLFVRSLAAMLANRLEDYAAQLNTAAVREALSDATIACDPLGALDAGVLTPLEGLTPDGAPCFVLIDALDEALSRRDATLTIVDVLAARRERLPGWLRIIATTRNEPRVLDRLKGLRARELDAQDPRNLDDIAQHIQWRLDDPNLAERLVQSRRTAASVTLTLKEKSGGNFLYVRQALEGIERDEYHFDRLEKLPPGLFGLYHSFFTRHFPIRLDDDGDQTAAGYEKPKRLLQVLVAAEEPLNAAQLAAATELDADEELPKVLRRLASYIPERAGSDGQSRYAFFHKSLADWLTSPELRGGPYGIVPKRGHQRLADLGWREYSSGIGSQPGSPNQSAFNLSHLTDYTVRHLPKHLIGAESWDILERLLTDLPYLETKTRRGLVFDLAVDLTRTTDALPIDRPQRRIVRWLDEALRRDIHFIARHREDYPQALFQCLWNSCWWYDCPQATKHYQPPEGGWSAATPPPWRKSGPKLCELIESWQATRQQICPGEFWLRAQRPPPLHLGTAQQAIFRGHEDTVRSVSYSPDGQRIVSGAWDKTVRVWDAASGAEILCLRGHESAVTSAAYSPDGRRIVSGSSDNTVRVWDAASGAELRCLRGHEGEIRSVSYSPDSQRIVSGSYDKTVRVWDADSGAELDHLCRHEDAVSSVSYSPDGLRIVSGAWDHTVRVWDAVSGAELRCLHGHEDCVRSVAFSPDGQRIVSGSYDKTVRVWDAWNGAELHSFCGHENRVRSVSYSPDGRRIVSGAEDQTVRVWDAAIGAEPHRLRTHEKLVRCVSYSPDGQRIVSGADDKTARVWDAESGEELLCLRGHQEGVECVSYSPDGRQIVTGSEDQTVRVWDAANGTMLHCLRGHENCVWNVSYSPNGRWIVSGSGDNTVRVWDAANGAELHCLRGHEDSVSSVSFSPDGQWIVSGSRDQTVRVWDAASGVELLCLHGHEDSVWSVSYSPNGERIVSRSGDGTVRVWDTTSGAELHCLRGHQDEVTSVSYSPDGQRIVSGSRDLTLRLWDAETFACQEVMTGMGDVAAIATGATVFPWRAIARGLETVIEDAVTGRPIAWFPVAFGHITTHPSGRQWVGTSRNSNHVYLFTLKGPPALSSRRNTTLLPPTASHDTI